MIEKPKTVKQLDDEISKLLKTVVDNFSNEDIATRESQVRRYRRLKLYWNNLSQIYWDESAKDYKTAGAEGATGSDNDQAYYDRPVNVYRAFLETIIAALSVQIPAVVCVPDDADNPIDLSTAKAGNKIGELLYKHNNVIFLWLHALYVYCTEGMIACYTYAEEDEKYGTYKEKIYKDEEQDGYSCPTCGAELPNELVDSAKAASVESSEMMQQEMPQIQEPDMMMSGDDDIASGMGAMNLPSCPRCGEPIDPAIEMSKITVSMFQGTKDKPKARICMQVYGGLYVKVANYAKDQKDTPYLIFSYETHYANALHRYPLLRNKISKGGTPFAAMSGMGDQYDQTARLNPQYGSEYPIDNVTIRNVWLRPAAFYVLPEADCDKLEAKFPDGVKVVFVNEQCADYCKEKLDDHWTLTKNPTSDYLTHEPLGELLTNIQDIINDLISLTLQTIEHGIVQTWADPAVVNFNSQSQLEATPGSITATKPQSGKSIGEAFYSSSSASLSPEVFNFYKIVQELGQFVSGALPSLFGGQGGGSSKTASEYAMSRSMALQRLQTPWKMLTIWWKTIFSKAIPMYMNEIIEDERIVERTPNGNFVNTFIRRAELGGKLGDVELESSDQLPVTDEQKREVVMQLMQLNNIEIMQSLTSPENLPFIRKVVNLPDFRLVGEDDRQKQYEEINQLIAAQPITLPPQIDPMMQQAAMMGDTNAAMAIQNMPPQEVSSVEIDVDVDNHEIESAICRSWLVSEAGRLAKMENPEGYKNVLLHMKAHMDVIQQQMMAQQAQAMQQQEVEGNKPGKQPAKPPQGNTDRSIKGEEDVNVPIQ